ncbi:hypothetical protein VHARVF571_510088 [Vibrio harveyi]|nr:hypothetical protein VHARVF571_510088 [Vibrio harveyi]
MPPLKRFYLEQNLTAKDQQTLTTAVLSTGKCYEKQLHPTQLWAW